MIRRLLLAAAVALLPAFALAAPTTTMPSYTARGFTNDGSTGTTVNKLVKVNSSGNAVIVATTDTDGAIGIAFAGAGTSGTVQVIAQGVVSCAFDGTATAGHFVTISSTTAGDCHDAGTSLPSSQVVGIVSAGGSGAGTYTAALQFRTGSSSGSVATTYPLSGTTSLTYVGSFNQGRLTYVSTTAVKFAPFNGDLIRINGAVYQIPSAGIAGCTTTSAFVNGTGSSSLSASTFYYVYAFVNSGTVTCDFSTTTHATSSTAGNIGTEVKSGDNTRTLIGMVETDGSSHFVDDALSGRYVVSWFNRRRVSTSAYLTTSRAVTGATTYTELNSEIRNKFLIWSDEAIACGFSGSAANSASGAGHGFQVILSVNGSTPFENYWRTLPVNTSQQGVALSGAMNGLGEGLNFVTLMYLLDAGADTLTLGNDGTNAAGHRTAINCNFNG